MTTADLLQANEICERRGLWARQWQPKRLSATDILQRALRAALTDTERKEHGEVAGETVMELAAERGMEMPASRNLHDSVLHHAALADMLATAVRRPGTPAWGEPAPGASAHDDNAAGELWRSSAFLSPDRKELRRIVLASTWNDDRHYAEIRSWYGIGEVAVYALPMTMVVLILGQHRDGRRQGPWARGFQHPRNRTLRFRKRSKASGEVFSESWSQIWREDHAEISNRDWLQAMLEDDVLRDVMFPVPIALPSAEDRHRIRLMAQSNLEQFRPGAKFPPAKLSVCDRPRCPFLDVCLQGGPKRPAFLGIESENLLVQP